MFFVDIERKVCYDIFQMKGAKFMGILEHLCPKEALRYFEEICGIPHGSGDTAAIADYCVAFAEKHGLSYLRDDHNNVVIRKAASPGYEDHPTVILQGHLDMVCEKDPDCDIDFTKDGLRLKEDGTYIYAEGTTLGGDDGIAIAYALAVLAAKDLRHPPLEAVFTTDEETGMYGADALDMSVLQGRVLLNIDSEAEGILTAGCAGGARSTLRLPLQRETTCGPVYRVAVSGLLGGHSGVEIDKGRANANKVLGELLSKLPDVQLISINGGSKDNAIPRSCEAILISPAPYFRAAFEAAVNALLPGLPSTETEKTFLCEAVSGSFCALTKESSNALLGLLNDLPNGIQAMSLDIEGLVQTSLNLGILETSENTARITFSVRSSVGAEKVALTQQLSALAEKYGAAYSQAGDYPAWEYQPNSRLREVMIRVFTDLYGKAPMVDVIHAGLECGIFSDRLEGLDAISFGPQMHDIHTSRERLEIASVERTWNYLLAVLAEL